MGAEVSRSFMVAASCAVVGFEVGLLQWRQFVPSAVITGKPTAREIMGPG